MYKVSNLVSGEVYETTDKSKWLLNADQQVAVLPNLVEVEFHNTVYIVPVGEVMVEWHSTAGTHESTYYRLTNKNIKSLVAYLHDKEKLGATGIHLHSAR